MYAEVGDLPEDGAAEKRTTYLSFALRGKLQGFEARFPDRSNNNPPSLRWIGEMDVSERDLPCAPDRPAPFLQRTDFGGVSVAFRWRSSMVLVLLNMGTQQQ